MQKYIFRFFLLCIALHLSSCLTFTEKYTFKKNGSGSMEYIIDMGEISSLLTLGKEDEFDPREVVPFSSFQDKLIAIKGISSVETLEDNENFLYKISFKFSGLDPLNKALNTLLHDESEPFHTFFEQKENVITRNHLFSERFSVDQLLGEEESSSYAKAILESVTYELDFSFKNSVKVVYSSSDASIKGKKNREVTIKSSLLDLSADSSALKTSIVLR